MLCSFCSIFHEGADLLHIPFCFQFNDVDGFSFDNPLGCWSFILSWTHEQWNWFLLQGIDLEPQWDQGEAILAQRKGCRNWLADHQSCTKRSQEGNFPTFCQMSIEVHQFARMHPGMQFVMINYNEQTEICKRLNVQVLPLFRFYRGAEGRTCSFSFAEVINITVVLINTKSSLHTLCPCQ